MYEKANTADTLYALQRLLCTVLTLATHKRVCVPLLPVDLVLGAWLMSLVCEAPDGGPEGTLWSTAALWDPSLPNTSLISGSLVAA